jgi:copper(I)-binding protein
MTKMLPVSQVMLSAKDSVKFQPGGMHLMLIKPKKHFVAGDSISVTLFFTDESSMKITAQVKKGTSNEDHSMHMGNHEDMHNQHNENHLNSHSH